MMEGRIDLEGQVFARQRRQFNGLDDRFLAEEEGD